MNSIKSKRQLTKNYFSLTLVQIANYVLPLVYVPIIVRIIGPDKYGLLNFSVAFIAYFNLLITYSFDFTATRKIARDPDNEQYRSIVFSEVFYTQCLLFVFAVLIFTILCNYVPELKSNQTVFIFTFFVCIATLFTQNWLFQAMQDLSKVALFNLISKVLITITILIVVRKMEDYIWQPFLIGIIQTIVAIGSFIWAIRRYNIKLLKVSLAKCWQVVWKDRIIFFSLVFVNLYSSTSIVILGLYQTPEQVGYFTSAQRLIIIAQSVLIMPIALTFYPFIGKAFGESREKGLRVAQKLITLIIIFIGLASIVMFFLGPFVIRTFYGDRFEPAIPVFQILSIVPLLFAINNVLGIQLMVNLGLDMHFFKITACAGIFSVIFNLGLIQYFGYMCTTINWLLTEVFLLISMYIVLKRQGLNPINVGYFKLSAIRQYIQLIYGSKT